MAPAESRDEAGDNMINISKDEISYYESSSLRSWQFGIRLFQKSSGDEAENIKIDLASVAFSYYLLISDKLMDKSDALEFMIKESIEKGVLDDRVMSNPLNWNNNGLARGIGRGGVLWVVKRDNNKYVEKVRDFKKYFKMAE